MESPPAFIDPALKRLLESSFDEELHRSVHAYIEREGMSPTRFGRLAVGDAGFLSKRLNSRKSVKLDTADRVRRFIGEPGFRALLCCEVDAFMAVTKLQPWILGDRAVRQTSFVARLRAGASPHIATVDRFRRWMREQVDADRRQAILTAVSRSLSDRAGAHGAPAPLPRTFGPRRGEPMREHPVLLTTAQAAAVVGLSPRTLERYRIVGGGPRFRKIGRWVRYLQSDLEDWLEGCARLTTSDDGSAVRRERRK